MPATAVAPTSRAAHTAVTPRKASIRDQVLEVLEDAGPLGATRDEILVAFTGRSQRGGTVSGRMSELEADSLIFRTSDTRVGDSGNEQIVWRHHKYATQFGVTMPTTPKDDPKPGRGFKAGVKWLAERMIKAGVHAHPDVRQALVDALKEVKKP